MYRLYISYHADRSICTGEICSEGWYVWMGPADTKDQALDHMVGYVFNDIYNTVGQSHGYGWYTFATIYTRELRPHGWYKTQEEAMNKLIDYISFCVKMTAKKNEISR